MPSGDESADDLVIHPAEYGQLALGEQGVAMQGATAVYP
jgi:hypothetical protein